MRKQSENLFLTTARFLEENGYLHYEISNFARGENNAAPATIRNTGSMYRIWASGLLPIHFRTGSDGGTVRSIKKYCASLEEGRAPVAGSEQLSAEQFALESLYLGLRTRDGIDLARVRSSHITDTVLPQLLKDDYVKIIGARVVPTKKGFLVADRLPLLFV